MKKLSEGNMKKLILAVAQDLKTAKLYLKYVDDISDFLSKKYPNVIPYSSTFWANTKDAYYVAMATCLMRVYDQRNHSIGLKVLLRRIKENPELFSEESFKSRMKINPNYKRNDQAEFKEKLNNHIQYVSNENKLVNYLVTIRNKNGFHRCEEVLYGKKPELDKIKLEHEEIRKLIEEGFAILNYYSQYFDAHLYTAHMVGDDDHEEIFRIIQKEYDEGLKSNLYKNINKFTKIF